jgi:hypothetical protein
MLSSVLIGHLIDRLTQCLRPYSTPIVNALEASKILPRPAAGLVPPRTPWKSFPRLEGVSARKDALMSPQRIDYYDSPDAPRATSLVAAVNVVVVNDAGEILLIRRTDNGNWAVPGGARSTSASRSPRPRSARPSRNPGSSARSPASWASTPTPGT